MSASPSLTSGPPPKSMIRLPALARALEHQGRLARPRGVVHRDHAVVAKLARCAERRGAAARQKRLELVEQGFCRGDAPILVVLETAIDDAGERAQIRTVLPH